MVPHIPEHMLPIRVEWYVHRKKNVPEVRNRRFTCDPAGSAFWNDQLLP
jgi:hypothetical protein